MSNKKLIKNLLTTASTLAVLTTGASALATNYTVSGGAGAAAAGTNISSTAGAPVQPVVAAAGAIVYLDGEDLNLNVASTPATAITVNFLGHAQNLKVGTAATSFIVANTFDAGTVALATAANNGAAIGAAGANATPAYILFNGVNAANLVSGLANVGTIDFANNAATLTIGVTANGAGTSVGKFTGTTFKSAGGNDGTLVFAQSAEINGGVFSGNGNSVGAITVNDGVTLLLSGGTNVGNSAATTTVAGAGVLTVQDTATVGAVTVSAAGTVNVASTGAGATAGVITLAADTGTVNVGAGGTAAGVVFSTANSTLNLLGGTVTSVSTGLASGGNVIVTGNATVTTLGTAANSAASVQFKSDNTLTLGAAAAVHGVTAITTATNNTGTLVFGAQNLTVGTVGAKGAAIKLISFGLNNRTLTVTGSSDFYGNVSATGGAAATGKIIFQKGLTVYGTLGDTNNQLTSVTVDGGAAAGTAVNLGNSLVNVATLALANAGQASLTSVGNAKMVVTADVTATLNKLTFSNPNAVTLGGLGTAGNKVNTVFIDGAGGVNVANAGNVGVANLTFTANGSKATVTVDDFATLGVITTATNGGTVAYRNNAATLTGDFGTAANSLSALQYTPTAPATAGTLDFAGHNVFAQVLATTADTLTVNNAGANVATTYNNGFGSQNARLAAVNFVGANTATVNGATFAKAVTIAAGTTVNFNEDVNGVDGTATGINFAGLGTAVIGDGHNLLNMPVTATNANNGTLTFAGTGIVGKVGATGSSLLALNVAQAAGKTNTLTQDIYAPTTFGAGTVTLAPAANNKTTITGTLTATSTTINLGSNNLTVTDSTTLTNTTITAKYSGLTTNTMGSVTLTKALVAASTGNKFVFGGKKGAEGDTLTFITAPGIGAQLATFQANTTNTGRFTRWSFVAGDANSLKVIAHNDVAGLVSRVGAAGATTHSQNFVNILAAAEGNLSGDAQLVFDLLTNDTLTDAQAAEAANRITASKPSTDMSAHLATAALDSVGSRMTNTGFAEGIAGGDEDGKLDLGVWVSGFASRGIQKARKGDSGYKANVAGGSVGVDTQVTENTMLGLAATYANSEFKLKDKQAGSKLKSRNMFFSVYGRHDLANNWYVQGNAGFGSGNVTSQSKHVIGAGVYDTATGKYDSMAFSLEALAGYNYKAADNVALVPAIGLRYMNVNEGGYTEKGSTVNLTNTKKAADKLTGILGASVQSSVDLGGSLVTPEAHAFVNYDFKAKNPKVQAKLNGLSTAIDVSGAKAARTQYNLGVSVTGKANMIEYGLGYDARLSNKYVSHQGTLRVKVEL